MTTSYQHELTTTEIVEAIESGKVVSIPCESNEQADLVRNNVLSRLYKNRKQLTAACEMAFQSVSTEITTAEDFSHVLLTFRLRERARAVFSCNIIEAEDGSNG